MARKYVLFFFGIVCFMLCYLTYINYACWTHRLKVSGVAELKLHKDGEYSWTDIAELFVRPDQKYKENDGVIYHCLSGDVYETVRQGNTSRRFKTSLSEKDSVDTSRQRAFQHIFDKQLWLQKKDTIQNKRSPEYRASGEGSSLEKAQPSLALLNSLIERLKIYLKKPVITMVDIPCGDFYWMRYLVGQRSDVKYTGIDIVPTLIERHKTNYGHMKNAQFKHADIVQSKLNESYDIIFSRDMLQHLTYNDVMKVLSHFSSSGSKLLVTTQYHNSNNRDVPTGGFAYLSLMGTPISLVPPVCLIPDGMNGVKFQAAWTLPLRQQT